MNEPLETPLPEKLRVTEDDLVWLQSFGMEYSASRGKSQSLSYQQRRAIAAWANSGAIERLEAERGDGA